MKKKRIIIFILSLTVLLSSVSIASAMTVSASSKEVYTKAITSSEAASNPTYWVKGYFKGGAKGYITSSSYHYANVRLYAMGQQVRDSGRKWGTGKVSVDTGYATNCSAWIGSYYGSSIYYGN